ncbi:MAG: DUF2442 domain-containing protein [Myxococcales bacterium]
MPNDLTQVEATDDFMLVLTYANGEHRRFDMKPLLALKPWTRVASPAAFKLSRAEYGTVVWPGGVDVAPETLYLDSVPIEPTAVRTTSRAHGD